MNTPWTIATTNRPSVSPVMIVPADVGVENIRFVTPNWRVRMSCVAAVIEVRNMNRTSWLCAPSENMPIVRREDALADVDDRDVDPGQRALGLARALRARRRTSTPRCAASRAAVTCADWRAIAAATPCWRTSAPGRLADHGDLGRGRPRSVRVVAGRDDDPHLDRALLDRVCAGAARSAKSLISSFMSPVRRSVDEIRAQRPHADRDDPEARRGPAAVHHAQDHDEDDRQQEDEEEARPVAQEPDEVDLGDGERAHRAATTLPARSRPEAARSPAPMAMQDDQRRHDDRHALADGEVVDPAQEPGVRREQAQPGRAPRAPARAGRTSRPAPPGPSPRSPSGRRPGPRSW